METWSPPGLDGVDQSSVVTKARGASSRTDIVYNLKIKPMSGAIRVGDYKLMFAPRFNKDDWYNPDATRRKERMILRKKKIGGRHKTIEEKTTKKTAKKMRRRRKKMIRKNKIAADFSERVRRMVSAGENGTVHDMEDNDLSDLAGDSIIIEKIKDGEKETIGDEEDGTEEVGEDDEEEDDEEEDDEEKDDEGEMETSRGGDMVKTASLSVEGTTKKDITSTVKPTESTTMPNIIQKRLKKVKRTLGDDDAINDILNNVENIPKSKSTTKKRDKMRRVRVRARKLSDDSPPNTNSLETMSKEESGAKDPDVEKKKVKVINKMLKGKKGNGDKKVRRKHSRNHNIKETNKRVIVKNLKVIGRRFNVRPSASSFYGTDRDWSNVARSANSSELSPTDTFLKHWPTLSKHLFNVRTDPQERYDLTITQPEVVERLRKKVLEVLKTFVPRDYPAPSNKGRPSHFNNVWSPGWC